jgi:hypothetical protein
VALAVLAGHWAAHHLAPQTFALLGDGYGFLGALIRRWHRPARVYCIDLPKMLVFQAATHLRAEPGAHLAVMAGGAGAAGEVTFVAPDDIGGVEGPLDCAVSMASFQEMNRASIEAYFAFLRQRSGPQSRLYCVNREEKTLPGGEVARFADYPWDPDDEVFLDGPCPYYRHFLARATLANGPRWLGWRVPFVNHFDGPMRHRLVRLAGK